MNVYEVHADSTREWARFSTVPGESLGLFDADKKDLFGGANKSIHIVRSKRVGGGRAKLPDVSCVNNAPYLCFGERAREVLGEYITSLGDWLPLQFEEAPYWLYRIGNVIDALNEEESVIRYFPGQERVMRIAEFAFVPQKLDGQLLFQPTQRPYNLATQTFVDLCIRQQLTGLVFTLLWSSEGGPVSSGLKDWERRRINGLGQVVNPV